MISKKLKNLVKEEARNLRIHATKDERMKLDFETFDPEHSRRCIYGQMAGDCDSERAIELLNISTKPYAFDAEAKQTAQNTDFTDRRILREFSPIETNI